MCIQSVEVPLNTLPRKIFFGVKIARNQNYKMKMKNKTYDEIIQLVNEELQQTETITFSSLRQLDRKLGLPRGTSVDASGWKDSLDFQFPAGNCGSVS
jgi:hypothetical protein